MVPRLRGGAPIVDSGSSLHEEEVRVEEATKAAEASSKELEDSSKDYIKKLKEKNAQLKAEMQRQEDKIKKLEDKIHDQTRKTNQVTNERDFVVANYKYLDSTVYDNARKEAVEAAVEAINRVEAAHAATLGPLRCYICRDKECSRKSDLTQHLNNHCQMLKDFAAAKANN